MSAVDSPAARRSSKGDSRGIGLATAAALIAAGAEMLTNRRQEIADAAAATLGDRAVSDDARWINGGTLAGDGRHVTAGAAEGALWPGR